MISNQQQKGMLSREKFVVVGAGHAGGRAVMAMRSEGFRGRIVLIGEEKYLPYERPPLSKAVLAGDAQPLDSIIRDQKFFAEHDIELILGKKVVSIDINERQILMDNQSDIAYDKLLLTTGARARTLDVPGREELSNIFTFRTVDDAIALRPLLTPNAKVVLVGGGFIGLELAACAARLGSQVTVLEAEPRLMSRVVPEIVANYVAQAHQAHGVKLLLGTSIAKFLGTSSGVVSAVVCDDGTELEANVVVIGIGAIPNTEIAQAAGILCDNGILVDEYARTSEVNVFAAGDVTNHYNTLLRRRIRLESWENAEKQSLVAARTMCQVDGDAIESVAGVIPWFWTDQYYINLQILGYQYESDQTIVRGQVDEGRFCVFKLALNRIVGAALVNSGMERRPVMNMMASGKEFDGEVLADSSIKLRSLMCRQT